MGKIALVGHTGFVGSNILASAGRSIAWTYNSKNIAESFGTHPDLLIYAGLRAEKYLANNAPEKDLALIREAEENITKIGARHLVLISTIDVFKTPRMVDEESPVETRGLHPYGYDRHLLELWARDYRPDSLIVRLPALFGKNIKKNFIYDLIHIIPMMLKGEKFQVLAGKAPDLRDFYLDQGNGFYKLKGLSPDERSFLKQVFRELGFSALHFTDCRSRYQFYPLHRLWDDIRIARDKGLTMLHTATEPISAGELYHHLTGEEFLNELDGTPADYDYRTIHGEFFGGENGYICGKGRILEEIARFVRENL